MTADEYRRKGFEAQRQAALQKYIGGELTVMPEPTSDPSSRGRGYSNFFNSFMAAFLDGRRPVIAFGTRFDSFASSRCPSPDA
jgi:hypothetical protein